MNGFQDRLLKFFFSRRGLILSLSLSLLVLLIFFIQMFGKAYGKNGWDFSSYLLSSRAFFNGTNPYTTGSVFPFIYPLFVCIILFPLASLPYWIANVGWFVLSALTIYFSAFIILKMFDHSLAYKHIAALILIPFSILIDVIQNNLLNGQINIILLLLCALFFKYCLESRKLLASFLLSAAISIKLTPAIFLVYLIIRREFLLFGLTVVLSAFFIFGVPYALAGQKSIEWHSHYIQSFLIHTIAIHSESSDGFGFSITSVFSYFFPSIPKLLSFLIAGLISILPIAWLQSIIQKDDANKQTLLFSLYMIATLLISPMSETHHLINLFPAVLVITFILLFQSKKNFQTGILILSVAFISLFTRKIYFGTSIIAVLALYGLTFWESFQPMERAIAYNKQNTVAPFVEKEL